jgi:hypothetical protein
MSVFCNILFNVLHLFTHLIDDCFQLKANGGQGLVQGLGTQRIGFAVEFLRQKIKFAACGFGRNNQGAGRFEVGKQAVELLLNVCASLLEWPPDATGPCQTGSNIKQFCDLFPHALLNGITDLADSHGPQQPGVQSFQAGRKSP